MTERPDLDHLRELYAEYVHQRERQTMSTLATVKDADEQIALITADVMLHFEDVLDYVDDLEAALHDAEHVANYAIAHVSEYLREKHGLDAALARAQMVWTKGRRMAWQPRMSGGHHD